MVVFGYPTAQQKEREKPRRFDQKYIVQENGYHELTEDELRDMFSERTAAQTYEAWMQAFCDRKYNSGFAREMSRSVRIYLDDFLQK